MKFNEGVTVEKHIIKFISDKLGYDYIKSQEFEKLREFENEYLIESFLFDAIKKINIDISDDEVKSVIREIRKIDNNEDFLEVMRNGVNLKDPKTGKSRDYKIIDFENIENNSFIITNQFYFAGELENIRPDIIIFLNGLPIVDIEAKSPTASELVDYKNAIGQIKRYERVAKKMFWPNCFNIVTDGMKTFYGATYSPEQYFFPWKDDELKKKSDGDLEVNLMALLEKTRLLDIIKNFILFDYDQERNIKIKKMCRYQQFRATNKIVERVEIGKDKKGLVWHTQGSGKSLTMFFTAWKLRYLKKLKNPKVFILVDRIDLDDQIYKNFENFGGKNIIRVDSIRDLRKKIESPESGIFISTIQKFEKIEDANNPADNIIVLIDEGHRSNEGVSGINVRHAMKNAFYFGFTGTPIDKLTLNTHRNFGEQGERYLDYYSIQQAIDDNATLPVYYEARLSKFFIDEKEVDKQFDEWTFDLNKTQKNYLTKKYGKKNAVVKLDKRMRAVISDIVEHYKSNVLPNGFKAQIVCLDREATARYKELLDEIVPENWSAVVYSAGDPNMDEDELRKYNTNKTKRENIIKKFKDSKSSLKFLLVCDMLLTGFDAPIEQVMYLDKPLRDHALLQAIARTNRLYINKGCGKIIDYYGVTKNLYKALDFDENIVESALLNISKMKDEFVELLNEILKIFEGVVTEDPSMSNLRKCLKIFIDDEKKQQEFVDQFSRLKLLFEILSPDPFLKKYLRKFEWLTNFYFAFIKKFRSEEIDSHLLSDYGGKMKELIQKKVQYEGITKTFRQLRINDLANLDKYSEDDEEKALSLEKMLKQEISINIDTNPIFEKFSERLMSIKKAFEQNQIDLAERIRQYYALVDDIKDKNEEANRLGYNLKEYGLYIISEEFLETKDKEIIKEFIKEMARRLNEILDFDWQESSKRDEFLKDVKKMLQELVLRDYKEKIKITDFNKYMNRLVDVIIKKF